MSQINNLNMTARMRTADEIQDVLENALMHLDKVLNGCRTHAAQQAADKAARDFLASLI